MNLKFDNCEVLFHDNQIDCHYDFFLDKKIQWTLHLNQVLTYVNQGKSKNIDSAKIKEFIFEIDQGIQRAHNLTQIAKAYIVNVDSSEPIELFELCVREEMKRASNSKSFQFAKEIIKKLSSHYAKPYSFKTSIETKRKNKNLWMTFLIFFIALTLAILITYLLN